MQNQLSKKGLFGRVDGRRASILILLIMLGASVLALAPLAGGAPAPAGRPESAGPAGNPRAALVRPTHPVTTTVPYTVSVNLSDEAVAIGGSTPQAQAINDRGEVVGYFRHAGGCCHAFLWLPAPAYGLAAGMHDLGALDGDYSEARDINNAGQIVGWYRDPTGFEQAFLWQEGTMTNISWPGPCEDGDPCNTQAFGINEAGAITGYYIPYDEDQLEDRAFIRQNGAMSPLPSPAGQYVDAAGFAINDLGDVAGYADTGSPDYYDQARHWISGTLRSLGGLGGNRSEAWDLDNQGQAVGWAEIPTGEKHAVLWQNGEPLDLHPAGATTSQAEAINEAGTVLGLSDAGAFLWQEGTTTLLSSLLHPDADQSVLVYWASADINEYGQILTSRGILSPLCPGTSVARAPAQQSLCPAGELVADALEVTQGVQDLNNSVRLVAGKRTFVRFHAHAEDADVQAGAVLTVSQGPNQQVLYPLNGGAEILARTEPERAMLDHAFLFELPTAFTQGEITLAAHVDPEDEVVEENEGDNAFGPLQVTFEATPPVPLVFTRIGYTLNGTTYWPAINPDRADMLAWLRKAFPLADLQVKLRRHYIGAATVDGNNNLTDPDCVKVNTWLEARRLADVAAGWAHTDARYYGMVDDGGGFMRGCSGTIPSFVASGPSGVPDSNWAADWYGGHELAHAYGRRHAEFCDAAAGAPFPYPGGLISPEPAGPRAVYGFDLDWRNIYSSYWQDLMTYCDDIWLSDFTYEGLLDYFQSQLSRDGARGATTPGDYLLLSGTVDPESGDLVLATPPVVLPAVSAPLPAPGDHAIVLRDGAGVEIARYPFAPARYQSGPAPGATGEIDVVAVNQLVPFVAGAERIEVEGPAGTLTQVTAGAAPPTVTLLAPNGGEVLAGETVTVSWEMSDADEDPLAAFLQYSPDGGATWEMLALGERDSSVAVPLSNLAGSSQARFRVLVSDGVHTAADSSDAFFGVPNHPPEVAILSPDGGETVSAGQTLGLVGDAYDVENGTLSAGQIAWRSDVDGLLGNGLHLGVANLTPGRHTISLEADDGAGAVVSDTVTVTVVASPFGLPPVADELLAGPSLVVLDPAAGAVSATLVVDNDNATRPLSWTATANVPWLQLSEQSGVTPFAGLVVSVDSATLPVGPSPAGAIAFTSSDLPGAEVVVRVQMRTGSHDLYLPLVTAPQQVD